MTTRSPDGAGSTARRRSRIAKPRRWLPAAAAALLIAAAATPIATAAQTVGLTTPYVGVTVAPGSTVNFDLSITVTEADRVDLSLAGVPTDWTATLRGGGYVVTGVHATTEDPTTVRLDVEIPASATNGTSRITVTARSGTSTATLGLDITINEQAAGDLTLTTSFDTLRGTSSTSFAFDLTLHNSTASDLTFAATTAQPAGSTGWQVDTTLSGQAQAASATVNAGSTQAIHVSAKPPTTAPAGSYTMELTVDAGATKVTHQLSVEITGSHSMTFATADQRLNASVAAGGATTLNLTVENTGTAPLENISLNSTKPTDWTVTFDPATIDSVPVGGTADVSAVLTPSSDAIAGDYQVTLSASGTDVNESQAIRVTVEASIFGTAIGLGVLVVAFVGLWWVFRTYGRR